MLGIGTFRINFLIIEIGTLIDFSCALFLITYRSIYKLSPPIRIALATSICLTKIGDSR